MSFSSDVKKELLEIKQKNSCCKKAFVFGAAMASEIADGGSLSMRICDDNSADAVIFGINKIFKKDVAVNKINRGFCNLTDLSFVSPAICNFVSALDTSENTDGSVIDMYLKCDTCISSFIRGVFCAAGSISDPHKSFTLEIVLPTEKRALHLKSKLEENGLTPGMVTRKKGFGLFFRNGEAVENFLTICGANETVFELYNSQIERDIRNNENRATNCVAMNIQRSVASATKHIRIIEDLKSAKLFEDMPDDLKLTATLRMENPEMSLIELAGIHKPAISKSGLNHRLAKITEYATKHGIV